VPLGQKCIPRCLCLSTSSRTSSFIYKIVTGLRKGTSRVKLYGELGWDSLQNRRKKQKLILMFKALEGELPNYVTNSSYQDYVSSCAKY
jgi:hypothetical protein